MTEREGGGGLAAVVVFEQPWGFYRFFYLFGGGREAGMSALRACERAPAGKAATADGEREPRVRPANTKIITGEAEGISEEGSYVPLDFAPLARPLTRRRMW
ncbi:hypothetical protein BC826DRAFT_625334 [Russula brevipes]|nr:hypothetical protein BC826DRAFT_625334 [Russula brevipes]